MKKVILSFSLLSIFALTSCGGNTETVNANDAAETTSASEGAVNFQVDTTSTINWKGGKRYEDINKPEEGHVGFVKLSSGEVHLNNGVLESGNFVADFTSFESTDLNESPEDKAKLDGHLKSADFLDVEKFPNATFEITAVKPLTEGDYNTEISGNLDFRGTPKNITFRANVTVEGDKVTIKSEEFAINRQDFGITFAGGGGAIIKDEVILQADIVATEVK